MLEKTIKQTIQWERKEYECELYSPGEESQIVGEFFFWLSTTLLAEVFATKRPPLPNSFTERFVCYLCGLYHHHGAGPDAFEYDKVREEYLPVEIKATITEGGFNDIKRDLNFKYLYWLSFKDYKNFQFSVSRISSFEIESFVAKSNTKRDRGTVSLTKVFDSCGIKPIVVGRIGVVPDVGFPANHDT